MLIAYDLATGDVLDNTGTNSRYPEGPPDDFAYVNTDARGVNRGELALLRLHDDRDHEQVQAIMANYHHVDVSDPGAPTVVVEGPYPSLTSDTPTIPADGTTPAAVTYASGRAPASVTFDVNGAQVTEDVTQGTASIEVTADAPGPVVVTCEGQTATIQAEEVAA